MPIIAEIDTLEELRGCGYIRAAYKADSTTIVILREAFIEHEITFEGKHWTEIKIIKHLTTLFQWK